LAERRPQTGENYCANCGKYIRDDPNPQLRFCRACGVKLLSPLLLGLEKEIEGVRLRETELKSALAKATEKPVLVSGVLVFVDGENLYMKTSEYLKAHKLASDMAASNDFIIQRLQGLVHFVEDTYRLGIYLGYYYMTKKGRDDLLRARLLEGFTGVLQTLHINIIVTEKAAREHEGGDVDPRLISDAYRLIFIEKRAPSTVLLVSGDGDYARMLSDYGEQGRKVVVCFYQHIREGGMSKDLLSVRHADFIDFTDPEKVHVLQ